MFEEPSPGSDLAGLREIRLPEPVSYAPATDAWWVLLAVVLILLACLAYVLWRRWKRGAYRRAALAALDELRPQLTAEATRADALGHLAVLVKHTALDAWPRTSVASLGGDAWLSFLDTSYGGSGFTEGPGRVLPELAFDPPALANNEAGRLCDLVATWIRTHSVGGGHD